jgi:hypothetical protein
MTRPRETDPTDGFLDQDFASFREARLRGKRRAAVLEPSPRRPEQLEAVEPAPPAEDAFFGTNTRERATIRAVTREERTSSSSVEALLDALEPEVAPAPAVATPTATAPEPVAAVPPAAVEKALDIPDRSPMLTPARAMPRPTARTEPSSHEDPEFERFRAARARQGDSASHKKPDSASHKKPDSASHKKPDSASHKKPDSASHKRPEPTPEATVVQAPRPEPRRGDSARHGKPGRRPDEVEATCSDPEFERFRQARITGKHAVVAEAEALEPRRPDSASHRKPALEEPVAALASDRACEPAFERLRREPAEAAAEPTAPEPPAAPAPAAEGPLFFGTNVRERAALRGDLEGAAAATEPEGEVMTEAEEAERPRRTPPPPLPERPRQD